MIQKNKKQKTKNKTWLQYFNGFTYWNYKGEF